MLAVVGVSSSHCDKCWETNVAVWMLRLTRWWRELNDMSDRNLYRWNHSFVRSKANQRARSHRLPRVLLQHAESAEQLQIRLTRTNNAVHAVKTTGDGRSRTFSDGQVMTKRRPRWCVSALISPRHHIGICQWSMGRSRGWTGQLWFPQRETKVQNSLYWKKLQELLKERERKTKTEEETAREFTN